RHPLDRARPPSDVNTSSKAAESPNASCPAAATPTNSSQKVTNILDGHDTRQEARSIEYALMRDADRAWHCDRVGIGLASGWFGQTPDYYTDRLEHEIIPELITEAAIAMAHADLKRSG